MSVFINAQVNTVSKDSIDSLIKLATENFLDLNNAKSLKYSKEALNFAYKINSNEQIAKIYNIIGLNYTEFSDYTKAEDSFLKSIEISKEAKSIEIESWVNLNLANLYYLQYNDNKKAIFYYKKSLEYNLKQNSEYDILATYLNLAMVYFDDKDFASGLEILKKAENLLFKVNENSMFITFHSNYAAYYHEIKDYKNAEYHYIKAESYCKEDEEINFGSGHAMELYDDIARLYSDINKKDKAYDYLLKHAVLRDSIYSIEKMSSIADAGSKLDVVQANREIELVEKENEQQKKVITYTKIILVLFLVIGIGMIVFIIVLIYGQKQKTKLIDEIALKNTELEKAKINAEEISEMKSQFISQVSHELRTPLYGVIGLAQILEQDFPVLKNNNVLNSLNFSANYLMNLINDLLQLQKIESNTIKLDNAQFNLLYELNYITNSLSVIAHKNKNQLISDFKNVKYEYLESDKLKLNQILFNVVSNALKFTKNGIVSITVSQNEVIDNVVITEFIVKDSGIGISAENLKLIFNKFSQFNLNGTDYQGTGLGLSIVKQLVDLLNGSICVTSELNKGTTFKIQIPFSICKKIETQKDLNLFSTFDFKAVNILLVENNEINRLVNQRNFTNFDIPCTIVSSAKEALKVIENQKFDVILTDINMPEMDGFEMASIIKQKFEDCIIIALTAYTKDDVADDILNSGIDDLVTKPFEFETLLTTIYKLIIQKKAFN